MKLRQFFHLTREGFRNTWQNRLMALPSVGVLVCCLMLTGFAYLIYVNVEQMFQNAYEQNVVAVYLDTSLADYQVERIGRQLEKIDNVDDIRFLSKEDFLAQYGDALADETMESFEGENNPLPDTYIIAMKDLSLFRETIGRYDFPEGDYHTLIASLTKLVKACGDRDYKLYPGHGASTHLSYELEHNLYLN
jgi:cell division transport system permease protein